MHWSPQALSLEVYFTLSSDPSLVEFSVDSGIRKRGEMLLAATSENLLPPKKITQSENSKMSQTEWSLGSNQAPKIYDYGEKS